MMKRGRVCLSILLIASATCLAGPEPFDPARLEREILVPAARDAIQMAVLPEGDIVFAEFWGTIKRWEAKSGLVTTLGKVPAHAKGEVGLLGMALARDFASSGQIFVLYCPAVEPGTMRVSRFVIKDGILDIAGEEQLLDWPYETEHVFHMGGAMWMDGRGYLYIGNGDNCHWNPGLPVDPRPGRKSWDAQRSAANSRDFRGKILRIQPNPDSGYVIPKGNLFPGGKDGLPEIYCMGIRNPFRISVDDATGTLYIGDVGPNILPELGVKPLGYEEINATREAANFGWPYFVGPNEALPLMDFATNQEIRRQDPAAPRNESPNNTGLNDLPPARPALIWYSSLPSQEFPTLGSGGRSIMAGPVYRFDPANPSPIKLPEAFDGRLFIFEWMRNWVQTVKLGSSGPEIEPFVPDWDLRRPIDLKIGSDGALYMIEYGDQWWENRDSRIVRVGYRAGNRAPAARLSASETAGQQPLQVTFDAGGSRDADGDELTFAWRIGGTALEASGPDLVHRFAEPGRYEVTLTVSDPSGASSTAQEIIEVGNGRPEVGFATPAHGSFFDWGARIPYQITVREQDGDPVDPALASMQSEFRSRPQSDDDVQARDPGLALMRASTCFACHQSAAASAGPPYRAVALKYQDDPGAIERLAQKVISGGAGVWGELPMPPHPQHELAQARQMVSWVLSLKDELTSLPQPGSTGTITAPKRPSGRTNEGVLLLTASYSDDGKGGTRARLRGEARIVLHSRRKKAALFDANQGMAFVEQVEGEKGLVGHFRDGAHIVWRELNLEGIAAVTVRAGSFSPSGGVIELRAGSPEGTLLATVPVPLTGGEAFVEQAVTLTGSHGLTDVCVIARCADPKGLIGLNWVEFQPVSGAKPL